MTGRMAKLSIELSEQSRSDTVIYPAKKFVFPQKGFAGRGIVVTKLLDWLLNHNMTTPGKLMFHGVLYDVKRNGVEKKIDVIPLGTGILLRPKDYISTKEEVKK